MIRCLKASGFGLELYRLYDCTDSTTALWHALIRSESLCAGRVQASRRSKLAGARSTGECVLLPNDSHCRYTTKSQQHLMHSQSDAGHG